MVPVIRTAEAHPSFAVPEFQRLMSIAAKERGFAAKIRIPFQSILASTARVSREAMSRQATLE